MTGEIPTKFGDVIVLAKAPIGSLYLVCSVKADGQQGCTADRHNVSSKPEAVTKARSLVVPGGRIFFRDQDSGEWEQISN